MEFDFVVESCCGDGIGCCGGFVESGAQSVPGGIAKIGHGRTAVGLCECVGHDSFRKQGIESHLLRTTPRSMKPLWSLTLKEGPNIQRTGQSSIPG